MQLCVICAAGLAKKYRVVLLLGEIALGQAISTIAIHFSDARSVVCRLSVTFNGFTCHLPFTFSGSSDTLC